MLQKVKKYNWIAGAFLCIGMLAFVAVMLNRYFVFMMDSDMASELVLSKLLNAEGKAVTDSWFYSTEIRVINTQLVFAPLFSFFSSWHRVRVVGTLILMLILAASFIAVCRCYDISYGFFACLMVVGSVSTRYFRFVIAGSYYIPHIAIAFLTLAFSACAVYGQKAYVRWLSLAAGCLVAVAGGLNGLRLVLTLAIPLVISSFVMVAIKQKDLLAEGKIDCKETNFKSAIVSCIMAFSVLIGYVINSKVLRAKYTFDDFEFDILFRTFKLSKAEQLINGWLDVMGYRYDQKIFNSRMLLANVVTALMILLVITAILYLLKKKDASDKHKFVAVFTLTNIITMSGMFMFTSMSFDTRYLIPVSANFALLIAAFVTELKVDLYRIMALLFITVSMFFSTFMSVSDYKSNEKNSAFISIKDILITNEITNGYASFWNANILTEMSDGRIEVWDFGDTEGAFKIDSMHPWLQVREHRESVPEGKVFLLTTMSQFLNTEFAREIDGQVLYEDGQYILLAFESYENLLGSLQQ